MTEIQIWTDGACRNPPGQGGWAAMLRRGTDEQFISGACSDTTNNRMELTAVINGIKMLDKGESATLYSDSQYVINGITKWIHSWKKHRWTNGSGSIKNRNLWEELDHLANRHTIHFKWIRGHSTSEIHEVDRLAKIQTH